MVKKIIAILAIIALIGIAGCSKTNTTSSTTQPASVKTVREAPISGEWMMKQIQINLESSISLVLTVSEGSKVDGYFYLEKGDGVDFQISGNSMIYESKPTGTAGAAASDRFSFTASHAQGIAYTLTFSSGDNGDTKTKTATTVYLELIYPITGSMYVPIGTK